MLEQRLQLQFVFDGVRLSRRRRFGLIWRMNAIPVLSGILRFVQCAIRLGIERFVIHLIPGGDHHADACGQRNAGIVARRIGHL
ncbi:hypothetical protein SDC9_211710 [bioreactor metagenome]|uniref:Uncharacterized protein n=1 Tax=bioreactor metagenome TaxID=1076179 RepID=A0A645JXU1_9ZZZZ